MVVRLFVLLIAMVLVAAPVDAVCGEPLSDAAAELAVCDDLVCAHALVVTTECRTTSVLTPRGRATIPPTPALARIFRPPRPALARTLQAIA